MKQVIVIRKDLGMRRGKEVVQGCHASQLALKTAYASAVDVESIAQLANWDVYWGMRKVCVRVDSLEELKDIYDEAVAAKLPCSMVVDEGLTEFNGVKTETAVAIGPADDEAIDLITGRLKLY